MTLLSSPWPQPVALDFDGGLVLVEGGRSLRVYDELAAALWHALAEGHSEAALVADLEKALGKSAALAGAALIEDWQAMSASPLAHAANPAPATDPVEPPLAPERAVTWQSLLPGGLCLSVTAPDELADWLQHILPPPETSGEAAAVHLAIARLGQDQWRLSCEEREVLTTPALELVQGAIYQTCLDILHGTPEWRAMIHGAAVAVEGAAIGLPAMSGSGKSTLSALLAARGWRFMADDLLAILPDGRAAPWPLPVSVKQGSVPAVETAWPGALGEARLHLGKGVSARLLRIPHTSCAQAPVPLAALVFPRFAPGSDNRLHPMRPLHALARLASDRLWIGYPLTPERAARFLAWLAAMPCYTLAYDRIEAVDPLLRDLAAGERA